MKALVLGGTRFLGRHLVDALRVAGHEVTLLNRGRGDPAAYPDLEQLRGDRDPRLGDGLAQLRGRDWDVVFDLCGYVPRVVRAACDALAGRVGRYVFVSSISVYDGFAAAGLDEITPLAALTDPATEEVMAHYGALKAACEREAAAVFGAAALIARPGLIVGPFDPTGRFTYWPLRIARGGDVIAPAPSTYPVQFIDARDLAQWMLQAALRGGQGAFNVTGPAGAATTLGDLLHACAEVSGVATRVHWLDADFLLAQGVAPWTDLPLWVGPRGAAMNEVSVARALATGLVTRPMRETIADTLAWARSTPVCVAGASVGLSTEREAQLLAAWRSRPAL
ncbi:MAG: NAD-dependent epimerase/dehydratase family protein [Burkholderiales bacterium]|nr:NAD-dependent epimerase/dehydratase family protein [Burkholderiales bacterium]